MSAASVFHLGATMPFDPARVAIEDNAPMNPPRTPPKMVSKWQPLLDRMKPGQSCVLEKSQALSFATWIRHKEGVKASQSRVTPTLMRIKIVSKP